MECMMGCMMNCSICLNDIKFKDKRTLSCEHVFHNDCIKTWFMIKKNECPICKCNNINILKNNNINVRYNEFENLVLNNPNKKWDYTLLTLHVSITKRFVKENPDIYWDIDVIYTIYANDPNLCELILQKQLDNPVLISKRILSRLTRRVRLSFISKFPNYNWNWKSLSCDSLSDSDSDSESDNGSYSGIDSESETDNEIDNFEDDIEEIDMS